MNLENGMISINSEPSIKLTLLDDQPFISKPHFSGFVKDNQNEFSNIEFNILILFMKEMTIDNEEKINSVQLLDGYLSQRSAGCSFWDTYYVYSTGGSRSVAEANLEAQTALEESHGQDVEECTRLGSTDSSCLWENHVCFATQAYCCD